MRYLSILLICLLPGFAHAAVAPDLAEDPVLEKRMIGLAQNLRCLVCQNESLASSRSELANDLRREVREQMDKGMTDQEIIDYLVARYGDFVLFDPPVKSYTLILWYGPFALLVVGLIGLTVQLRKRKGKVPEVHLSEEDAKRAAEMLNSSEDTQK
jgi:cytochrome c-type biogenesis protein CcmH